MSNFLLGVVGAVIGSAFGMPALGFALGSAVGGSHHHSNPSAAGRSLNDLKVQTATYGIGIPQVYGRYRLAGNLIWAQPIREFKGPKDRYSYYGSFALGFCQGPVAGIRRIWADGKEIFNEAHFLDAGIRRYYPPELRFYCGDDHQQPDPLIETAQDKGQTPAFRGLAYIVFDNLLLAAFDNRLPTIQVEVIQAFSERAATTEEARAKSYFTERTVRQGNEFQHLKSQYGFPGLPPGALIKIPAPVSLSEVVSDLCCQRGFSLQQVDTHWLSSALLGFVALPPLSARDVLASLMQVYDFAMTEAGKHLLCVPRGQGEQVAVFEADLAQEEVGDVFGFRMRRLPPSDSPQSLALLFNEAEQYTLITQRAQRSTGHRSERLELPLVLTNEEAIALVDKRLERAAANPLEYSFSLPRAYARLTPGDRLQWQDRSLKVVRVLYGSPGLVQVQAVEEAGEEVPASFDAGKAA